MHPSFALVLDLDQSETFQLAINLFFAAVGWHRSNALEADMAGVTKFMCLRDCLSSGLDFRRRHRSKGRRQLAIEFARNRR